MTRLRWFFALPALLIATTGPSDAAEIRDKAKLFSPEAVKKAEAELERIEKEYSVPVAIETVESLEGRKINTVLAEHARAANVKGIYILISKDDHAIQVETYKDYAKYVTAEKDRTIRDVFTREFKAKDFDAGLLKGIDKTDSTLSEARAEAGGSLRPKATPPVAHRGGVPPVGRELPGKPSSGGMSMWLTIGLGLLALFIVIRVLGAIFGGGNRGYAGNQRMMGPGGAPMGGPGYGPGYGGGGGGGGGGFMSSMFGGIGGALAGNWLYDQFSGGRHHDTSMGSSGYDPSSGAGVPDQASGPDYVGPADNGGDWGGGGADAGGGDWGGGGGDAGGDWGGGGGGGDWGGGGGDDGGSW
jgi:uncharacterized protein